MYIAKVGILLGVKRAFYIQAMQKGVIIGILIYSSYVVVYANSL